MRVLALFNIKGGVGKTSSAVNLAWLSAQEGTRTLLWDLDPQGAATYCLRVRPRVKATLDALVRGTSELDGHIRGSDFPGLDLLPADFSYRDLDLALGELKRPERRLAKLLRQLEPHYDRVFLDCPPSISLLSESVFAASDALLVPTLPTPLSLRTLARLMKHLKSRDERAPAVLPFFSMVDRRKLLHRETCDYAREHELGFLRAEIPYSSQVEQMTLRRLPLPVFAASDRSTLAFRELWAEIGARLRPDSPSGAPSSKAVKRMLGEVRAMRGDPPREQD